MLSYSTPFSGYSFSYDARNRLTESFVGAIGTTWLINGLGQRIAQMNGSVPQFFFVYDEAGHTIGKYDGGGNLLWETAWLGDLPVAVNQPGVRYYIAPDHLGSPHQITDASGAGVWLWNHDPYGNGDPTGTFSYDLRFPGQFFDQGTKLHYNYFRDYDPRTGRYIESDPIGLAGGINTYAYAGGNPLVRTDASSLVTGGFSPIPNTSVNAYEASLDTLSCYDAFYACLQARKGMTSRAGFNACEAARKNCEAGCVTIFAPGIIGVP
ncbi:MAG: RHS repeat domain-containing protein [Methylocella sp.]